MGNSQSATGGTRARVVASERTWIEGEAIRQLELTSSLPGMIDVVGMPDLHPGKGSPIGAAFLSRGLVRPALVGSDVGCGMSLWTTDLKVSRLRSDRIARALDELDAAWEGNTAAWLAAHGLTPTPHDAALGTVGRGNHFLEVQTVHDVRDANGAAALGLCRDKALLLVHSGSRGLGEAILREHAGLHGDAPLEDGSPEMEDYVRQHDFAVTWARANRDLIARRACDALGTDGARVLDVCHNAVVPHDRGGCRCWLHRKGAAPSDAGPVVVPGSRGDLSWLVRPLPGRHDTLLSIAHGAGRKIARHEARGKLRGLHRREDLRSNPWGGRVVCGDDALAWEEAPECYKPIETVISDMEEAGLIERIASMRPVVTFKTGEAARDEARAVGILRNRERDAARSAKYGRQGR
jgi:release factor H-coupled RctB family protein